MRKNYKSRLLSIGICLLFFSKLVIPYSKAESDTNSLYLTGGSLLDVTQDKVIPNALVIIEAKKLLKKGVDTWNSDLMKTARDRLIGLVARSKNESLYPMYYIALCDYRLATYYLTLAKMDKAGPYIKEGQDYLQKAMETNPDLGELDAFYAYMLGFEIALAPEKAMSLGLQIYQYFGSAFDKSPENPRVHLLKGVSDLFTPEQYGGGADRSIETLQKSAGLFEKEQVKDPALPSWGKDEAYTFLGMAYSQKGDNGKASEYFQKALEVNPENRLARDELKKIKK